MVLRMVSSQWEGVSSDMLSQLFTAWAKFHFILEFIFLSHCNFLFL